MRKMWARIRNVCTRNPILSATIALALLLGIGAIVLLVGNISYSYPGPAVALGILAIVVLLTGLALHASQAKVKNPTLSLPFVIGLDILVEHWMKLSKRDSAIMYEQLLLAQQVFNEPDIRKIAFLKRFPGHKPERSAFLVQPQNREAQVLKFDRIGNMRKERERFGSYVRGLIGHHVPGKPIAYSPPESEWTRLSDDHPGAVVYELAQLESAAPLTICQYYDQKDVGSVVNALNKIHKIMAPTEIKGPLSVEPAWWDRPLPVQNGLCAEYDRLKRKLREMETGWQEVCGNPSVSVVVQQHFSSSDLPDPLKWVHEVFDDQDCFSAKYGHLDSPGARRDSIVHGDFHGGNILVEDLDEPRIWLIDFPHTHVGPTVQDIARLEADIKFGHFSEELITYNFDKLLVFEDILLGDGTRQGLDLSARPTPQWPDMAASVAAEFDKAWSALAVLRRPVSSHYLLGDDAAPYYLALLHATLPVLYYQNCSARQKLYAFIAAAKLCRRLDR
jgi:hypothetical protein